MKPVDPHPFNLLRSTLLALPVALAACAPDAWRPDHPYDAFINQIQSRCYDLRVGSRNLGSSDLLADSYFLDVTSRFYHGETTQRAYVDALVGSYDARPDSAGIRCILEQMPRSPAAPPGM